MRIIKFFMIVMVIFTFISTIQAQSYANELPDVTICSPSSRTEITTWDAGNSTMTQTCVYPRVFNGSSCVEQSPSCTITTTPKPRTYVYSTYTSVQQGNYICQQEWRHYSDGSTEQGGTTNCVYTPPSTTPTNPNNPTNPTNPSNPPNQDSINCATAKNAAARMDSIFQAHKVDSTLNTLTSLATDTLEKGFPIYKNYYYPNEDNNDIVFKDYSTDPVQTGNKNSISIEHYNDQTLHKYVASLHTHPSAGYSAPSSSDIFSLIGADKDYVFFEGYYVAAADGETFGIQVTDTAKANAFYNNMNSFLDSTTHGWKATSAIAKAFKLATTHFQESSTYKNNSNVDNIAYYMAMSSVLSKFDSGVTLMKKNNTSGKFEPIMQKIIETTDANGKPDTKYTDAGCNN